MPGCTTISTFNTKKTGSQPVKSLMEQIIGFSKRFKKSQKGSLSGKMVQKLVEKCIQKMFKN